VDDDAIFLQTSGSQIPTRAGRALRLRGVSVGGWMIDALADSFRFDRCRPRQRLCDMLRATLGRPPR
jgi:hypothetical protein